jgi:hypothetical protein
MGRPMATDAPGAAVPGFRRRLGQNATKEVREEVRVTESYTVFWTIDRWLGALALGHRPLPVLFGGPHLSEPSFRRAGVKVGDLLYPVAVMNRQVYLIARMRVREMLLLGQEDGSTLIDQRFPEFKLWKLLAPTCTEEVVVGGEGTTLRADLPLPPDMLMRLTFRSQRGERPLKYVKDGELARSVGLHGIYRLASGSADDMARLIESPSSAPARIPRPERWSVSDPEDALF